MQEEFYTNTLGADEYENIEVVVRTADVMRQFDDVITESDVTERQASSVRTRRQSQDDAAAADMLSLAEHARLELIQRRSRDSSSSEPHDHSTATTGAVLRPVAQQRSQIPSDPQSEQFKQLLATKAANRRVSEAEDSSSVSDQQGGPGRPTPVPASRPAMSRTTSVDAAVTWRQQTMPQQSVKQKTRSVMSDDINRQQPVPVETSRY